MSKQIRIRNVTSGRDDEYVAEVVDDADASRVPLVIATAAEAAAGTDGKKIVAPVSFASALTDAMSSAGVVGLASRADTIGVSNNVEAITPYGLGEALIQLFPITFTGKNLAGACTVLGMAVDDKILGVAGLTTVGDVKSKFESVVTVANQIQQTAAEDLHLENYVALIYRPS